MYSKWAIKQRSKIVIFFSVVIFTIVAVYIQINTYKAPSCFDNILNQDEYGVDCGGVCELMCQSQIQPLRTLWTRSYRVSDTLWSAFAYIENPNPKAHVSEARYRFKVYNRDNELIGEREDTTFITHEIVVPVYAKRIDLGGEIPFRTEFEWVEPLTWLRVDDVYDVALEEQKLENIGTVPTLTATLVNKGPYVLEKIEVTAIIYDVDKNAVAVSKTLVDMLGSRGKRQVVFSWPKSFETKPERWEFVARIPPQNT